MQNVYGKNDYFTIIASRDNNVEIPIGVTIPNQVSENGCPVVVMLHGFLGTKDEWGFYYGATREERGFESIAARLLERGIGTIRMDMPGSGDSKDDFRNYTLKNCIADAEDAFQYCMEKYNFDSTRVGFLGWSMGAKIGAEFLEKHTDVVTSILLNPAGDNGSTSIYNAAAAGLDYVHLKSEVGEKDEVLNKPASEAFGYELYMSKDFFDQMEASLTGDKYKKILEEGRRVLMIYGENDSSISNETYKWLIENTGIQYFSVAGMDHDMGLESGQPRFTNAVIDAVIAYFNCYI